MEIHNFPMPVGPIISPAPLFVCLTHGTVDVLASSCSGQVLWECWTLRSLHPPSLAVCRPHQWLLLLWDLELWIWLEPGTGSCLSQSFCAQLSPPATRSKLWSCPGCVCRMWAGGGGGSPGVSAVLSKQAMQMWMEGKVGYCSTLSLCSGRWGNWEKETKLVWNCFKPADTQFPLPLLTLLPAKSFC